MGKSKRINPRKRPVTEADLRRAKERAENAAIDSVWAIFFTVLRDKHGATNDELRQFWNEVNELSDSIALGYVKVADLIHVIETEAGITLERGGR